MIQGPYCYSKSNQSSPILFYTTRGWNRGRKATWNYYTLNLNRKVVKRKINRMWNRILQSTTTFPSAGGGVIKQMCQDFCRKRKKYVDKHKRKVHFSEGYLEKEGVAFLYVALICHSNYPQSVSPWDITYSWFSLWHKVQSIWGKHQNRYHFYPCVNSVYKAEKQSDSHYFKKFSSLILMYVTQPLQWL